MADRDPLLDLLDRLDALEAKATPGPWGCVEKHGDHELLDIELWGDGDSHGYSSPIASAHDLDAGDLPFAAALRNAYPTLARALRAERERADAYGALEYAERVGSARVRDKTMRRLRHANRTLAALRDELGGPDD